MAKLILKGIAASPGTVEGVARIFMPDATIVLKEGEILVTTITDPTMVMSMIKAAAIITDMGGMTSHPAILSREMGIPCVVNTVDATKKIKDGTKIRVNGLTGEIYALD